MKNLINIMKKIIHRHLAIIFLVLGSYSVLATADNVDRYLQCEMNKLNIPGLSVALVENGAIIKSKGYGFSNVELKSSATPETIYQSGSIGKQFTAMLAMILTEKGLFRLDDTINQYLIDAPESWKDITILNLLNHTSGLMRDIPGVDWRLDYTPKEIIQKLEPYPLNFQPGSSFQYSNVGYELLGFIMEKITNKSYGALLQEHIFKPLNMTSARVINDRDIIPNRASGYNLFKGVLKNQEYISQTFNSTADGALYFTVLDLAKWDKALYTTTLLKKDKMKLLWTPVKFNNGKTEPYGLGWRLNNINGQRIVEHGGEWQGFTAFISRYVDKKFSVIIMTNLSGVAELGDITHNVAALYDKKLVTQKNGDDECI